MEVCTILGNFSFKREVSSYREREGERVCWDSIIVKNHCKVGALSFMARRTHRTRRKEYKSTLNLSVFLILASAVSAVFSYSFWRVEVYFFFFSLFFSFFQII